MANVITKTAKKGARKATKKVVKSGANYAKGCIARAVFYWLIASAIAIVPRVTGFELPEWATGADTIGMIAFAAAGFFCYGKKFTVGRGIGVAKTLIK